MADKEFKYLVRVANTDLDGNKRLLFALRKIKGVNIMLANAVLGKIKIAKSSKTGELSDEQIATLNEAFSNLDSLPTWLKNRQKDYESGEDKHLLTADLTFTQDNDVKRLKMIKSYKGLRHQWNLPVRGQRTASNFRRAKTANAKKRKRN